jgi:hypothetical protein
MKKLLLPKWSAYLDQGVAKYRNGDWTFAHYANWSQFIHRMNAREIINGYRDVLYYELPQDDYDEVRATV